MNWITSGIGAVLSWRIRTPTPNRGASLKIVDQGDLSLLPLEYAIFVSNAQARQLILLGTIKLNII